MRPEKIALGNYVTEIFGKSSFLYLIKYQGLTVASISELRGKLVAAGADCHVLKNTYIKLGLLNNGYTLPASLVGLSGDTAVVYGSADPCPVAKVIRDYGKDHEQIVFKAGLVDGTFLTPAECQAVADLPPREVLQALLLGVLQAPARNLVSVLNQKAASIVYVLEAYRQKLENAS